MGLKREVVESLKRERAICEVAIDHLLEACRKFERKYKMSTGKFVKEFEAGSLGDKEDFFKWYAIAEAMKDWLNTKRALREIVK